MLSRGCWRATPMTTRWCGHRKIAPGTPTLHHRSRAGSLHSASRSTAELQLRQAERSHRHRDAPRHRAEADDFASNLLMPGDLLRAWISNQRIDSASSVTSPSASNVSLEAPASATSVHDGTRHPRVLGQRAAMKYEWRSGSARRTRARIRRKRNPCRARWPLTPASRRSGTVRRCPPRSARKKRRT